ncbi:hypothetical protein WH96_06550 [Kiloniella spongiae]|uniref:Holin of 3TMs, for gene-transfer release n=1 Tax=Kiloniella spongiae TaxID=1489064 RepID=A0A0H2MKM5_9PROT|nr:3TM-type holin [Kiloniella spongiae]KLN61307.1 hypothetical protein WH96_06550 [Kiloniella spongiae]
MLDKLLGGEVVSAVKAVGNIVDDLWTTEEEAMTLELAKQRLAQKADLIQAEINKVEASHRSIFVAGGRPFIIWVCGAAMAYNYILRDLMAWVITNTGEAVSIPPGIDMDQMSAVLMGLLGLGGLRTVEKLKGRAK